MNAYIKYSVVAVPVGILIIGFVAAFTSATPYAWLTAFLVTIITRVHYVYTKLPNRRQTVQSNGPALDE